MSIPEYFTQPTDPTWPGEMPLPAPIGFADPGVSQLKSNADHTHELNIGGINSQAPWFNVLTTTPWTWQGLPYRQPQYTRLGNVTLLRGVWTTGGTAISPTWEMGKVPVEYAPASGNRETFPVYCANATTAGPGECSVRDTGQVVFERSTIAATYISFPTVWFITD